MKPEGIEEGLKEPLAVLLEQGEEFEDNNLIIVEDIVLLNEILEAKLQAQREASERDAKEMHLMFESKLQAIMNLLGEQLERKENVVEHSQARPTRSPTRSPSRRRSLSRDTYTPKSFGDKEALKALMQQIPDYNESGGVPKLLEFVDKFEVFREESELSLSLELQFATSKLTRDALIWW